MNIILLFFYNVFIYPILFFTALIISVFDKKLRKSMIGRFETNNILKNYFNKINSKSLVYWFHSSSLGEFYQIKPVLEDLKELNKDAKCIISFSSPSGFENVFCDAIDLKFYIPFDFPWTISRILKIINPNKIIFASYDIWPNLVLMSRAIGIQTILFSVRVQEGSIKKKIFFRNIYRFLYGSITSLFSISTKDMKGVCEILANHQGPELKVIGNPRYDAVMRDAIKFREMDSDDLSQRDFRIIIGSAHDYEEKYLIPALVDLMNLNSNLKVLYAPHEPFEIEIERIKSLFKENGFVAKIHRNKKNLSLPSDQLLILGVVGVLSKLYWQCRIAYVGGGHSTGVHNVMEPAVARLPVLFGPKYHNSHEAEELLSNDGGFCVTNKSEFLDKTKRLINDSHYLKMTSLSASDVIYQNLGSSIKMARNVLND
ncbi:MAG: 3-deoxy-D-manno-octulosonic acid transferase [Candidatus Neomarinimicrobiota bacterium]